MEKNDWRTIKIIGIILGGFASFWLPIWIISNIFANGAEGSKGDGLAFASIFVGFFVLCTYISIMSTILFKTSRKAVLGGLAVFWVPIVISTIALFVILDGKSNIISGAITGAYVSFPLLLVYILIILILRKTRNKNRY